MKCFVRHKGHAAGLWPTSSGSQRRIHPWLGALVLWLAAGCGQETAPSKPAVSTAPVPDAAARPDSADAQIEMLDIDMYMHDTAATHGEAQKPTLWIHMRRCIQGKDELLDFEWAHGEIHGRDAAAETIAFEAARGQFQEQKSALLEGGVIARSGTMTIHLEDIQWLHEERMGTTDHPVLMEQNKTHIEVDTLRLFPDENRFTATRARGVIDFEREDS